MNKILFISLLLTLAAYGQQTSVAVLPSDGTALSNEELEALTDEMRGTALKVLPTNTFVLLKQDVVIKRLGGAENYIKECSESSCIVDLGKKAQVDYVSQASVSKLGDKIRLKVELYSVRTEGLIGMLNSEAENVIGLLDIVKEKVPAEVFGKIPGALSGSRTVSPIIASGINGLESTRGSYDVNYEKSYLVNINTEPVGAALSFNGVPIASCTKTPCKAELPEGSFRIMAALEQYETIDTTVLIKQNNQSIMITLQPSFGVLEIRPAYSDGIGASKSWSLAINGRLYSSFENRFSPGNYEVKLSHECYEDISFKAGINKGSREVLEMVRHLNLKMGGLVLSAEADGEPVSEPVFVNGRRIGETPFSGSVPICAKIEIGDIREVVDVKIEYKTSKRYKHQMNKEEMEQRARLAAEKRAMQKKRLEEVLEQRARLAEEKQIQEKNEQNEQLKEKAKLEEGERKLRSPRLSIGGGNTFYMENINSLYRDKGGFFHTNIEFVSIASGHLRFGADFDYGMTRMNVTDMFNDDDQHTKVYWLRGGVLTRLYFLLGIYQIYLTADADWYKDWNEYKGDLNVESHSGTSFSIGGGLIWNVIFIDIQYFMMAANGHNANYTAIKGGIALPIAMFINGK